MSFTVSGWQMRLQHFLAWWRGDFAKITSYFEKASKKMSDHQTYLTLVADNQAHASRALAASAKANYDEASKAAVVAANFKALVQG